MTAENDFGEEVVRRFLEGDDVITAIGTTAFELPSGKLEIGCIFADYSSIRDEALCDLYTKNFEKAWVENHFENGFDLAVNGLNARVSSKDKSRIVAIDGEHTNVLDSSSYYVDLPAEEWPLKEFVATTEKKRIWMFHIKTKLASYLFFVDYPTGTLYHKFRRTPPMDVKTGKEK